MSVQNLVKQFVVVFIAAAVVSSVCAAAPPPKRPAKIPDFTQGDKTDPSHDWTLGATGARGWVYAWMHTADARQILITKVAKGSPADGVLEVGDVILGIDGKPFDYDARILFAHALTRAEREESRGVLNLIRWRDGQSENVEIQIPVMGTYSDTAPYDCEKSAKIFQLGCEAIAKKGLGRVSIPNSINALVLLASEQPKYQPLLADYAKQVSRYWVDDFATWHYGYGILFLAEYVMATGDDSVMPGLKRLALEAAHGQSKVGSWGHRFALPDGRVGGYGCMNSPGIPLTISMVLAREAGVNHPDLDLAITRSARFLRWYVDKGAIPYGDHEPWPGHEDNGKCSMVTVLFDLLGDREAASFFAKMSTAAYDERERGHTGNFFNILWAMPGVSRCGSLASAAYWREQSWFYDLGRQWDGSYPYQGSPYGEEEHGKYADFDSTGAYLLAYALPLKSLYITGKNNSSVPALEQSEVDEVIAAGRGFFSTKEKDRFRYQDRSEKELLDGLSSWSPSVRKRSAEELGKRKGNFQPAVLQLIASDDRYSRYGAAEALGQLEPSADPAASVSALTEALESDDLCLRILAGQALASIGKPARSAIPLMLQRLAMTDVENDPRGMEQRFLCFSLFNSRGGLIGGSLEGVDRELLLRAVRVGLQNEDGRARGSVGTVFQYLTYDEIKPLLPAIHQAIVEPAPSGIMFANQVRLAGVELLAKHRIREGMPLCIEIMEIDKWGKKPRITQCLETLETYGAAAKPVLPELRQLEKDLLVHSEQRMLSPIIDQLRDLIRRIENGTESVELRSISKATPN
ncbi:DUF6288 domain-containing protein [Aporhodopirellula aestuarii]|uniref:DUF6288 domain-containing protein n=1 Tax=Aporhodopirellula aestuarii TaxID=2950107 RepID=A0ABT0UFY2_9BACT|nr:DUF6288 domain-containing protein [Aporhodopirellula aestuarii]MCM2375083.1 DUF6288 domain-containing protein [Aporhodopirellula aestuarii]